MTELLLTESETKQLRTLLYLVVIGEIKDERLNWGILEHLFQHLDKEVKAAE